MICVMYQNIKIDNKLIKRPRHVAKLTDKINKKWKVKKGEKMYAINQKKIQSEIINNMFKKIRETILELIRIIAYLHM